MDISYNISAEQNQHLEINPVFIPKFTKQIQSIINTYISSLTETNLSILVSMITKHFCSEWEALILQQSFNSLGAAKLESEIRGLISLMVINNQWITREPFTKLVQISLILNLSKPSEIYEYWGENSGPITWRLTPTLIKRLMMLRIDFDKVQIKELEI